MSSHKRRSVVYVSAAEYVQACERTCQSITGLYVGLHKQGISFEVLWIAILAYEDRLDQESIKLARQILAGKTKHSAKARKDVEDVLKMARACIVLRRSLASMQIREAA
jgi:hypothetical protein